MILYMDTSALTKMYIYEQGSDDVLAWTQKADLIGTALITRVELVATVTRAIAGKHLPEKDALEMLDEFRANWLNFQHVNVDETLIARADGLAGTYALRGYDAIHLACALTWSDLLGMPVSLATFDMELHAAAKKSGIEALP
jgi:predicted nucleic acid-binding protein